MDNSKGRPAINSWDIFLIDDIKSPQRNSIAMGPFGSNIKKENFQAEGIPVIRGNNLKNSKFVDCNFVYISDKLANQLSASLARRLDIILTHRGTIGQVAIIPPNSKFNTYIVSQSQMKLTLDQTKCDPYFVYYFLRSEFGISQFLSNSSQTGVPAIASPTTALKSIKIPLPPLNKQKAIAKILFDLDSKTELNQKMNKTLEAIAQAIFKHWFIDFEFPNEEGKPYKSSGGEMVDSELGEIPNGWEVKKITEIGRLKNGINYTRDEKGDEEFYIVNVRDISKSKFIIKDDLNVIKFDSTKCKDYLLNQNDIIIARSASPGESSLILGNIDNVIHSGFSIRYRLSNPNFKWYVYLLLQHSKNILFRYSIGTALKSLNQTAVGNMSIIMPSVDVLRKFNSIDIINKIMSNLLESKALLNIRDLLLPKLIMGKIRVPLEE